MLGCVRVGRWSCFLRCRTAVPLLDSARLAESTRACIDGMICCVPQQFDDIVHFQNLFTTTWPSVTIGNEGSESGNLGAVWNYGQNFGGPLKDDWMSGADTVHDGGVGMFGEFGMCSVACWRAPLDFTLPDFCAMQEAFRRGPVLVQPKSFVTSCFRTCKRGHA